jgi:hypothetical protein
MSLTLSSSLLSYSTDLIMPLTLSSSLLSYSTELIMPLDNQFLSLPQHLSLWIGNGLLIKCVKICIQMNPAQFCMCPSRVSLPRWFCLFLRLFDWILELFRYVIYILVSPYTSFTEIRLKSRTINVRGNPLEYYSRNLPDLQINISLYSIWIKWKKYISHIGTVPISNQTTVERGKIIEVD